MHNILLIITASLGLATTLSLPLEPPILQLPPLSNNSFPNDLLPISLTTPLTDWPILPFHALVTEGERSKTYMIIDRYLPPLPDTLKGQVTGNITLIQQEIAGHDPDDYIDNKRIFASGLLSVRFPAVQSRNAPRMTNALAVELLGAAWGLVYAHGPRGWEFAMVEEVGSDGGRDVVGFFSLLLEEGAAGSE